MYMPFGVATFGFRKWGRGVGEISTLIGRVGYHPGNQLVQVVLFACRCVLVSHEISAQIPFYPQENRLAQHKTNALCPSFPFKDLCSSSEPSSNASCHHESGMQLTSRVDVSGLMNPTIAVCVLHHNHLHKLAMIRNPALPFLCPSQMNPRNRLLSSALYRNIHIHPFIQYPTSFNK